MAQVDYLLLIDTIQGESQILGESQDSYFKSAAPSVKNAKPIDILSFSFTVNNQAFIGSATSGAGAGKVVFGGFQFTQHVNTGSPALFQALCEGAHFKSAALLIRKAGGKQEVYLKYEFDLVFITSIQTMSVAGDPVPVEVVTIAYGALKQSYMAQTSTGGLSGAVSRGWSQIKNQKL